MSQLDARKDRLLYTYRTQEKAADRYARWDASRRWTSLFLTVLTTGTLVVAVVGLVMDEVWGNLAVAVIAALATMVSFLGDYFDFAGHSRAHSVAGTEIRAIYNSYESLIGDIEAQCISVERARQVRDELQNEEATVLIEAPRTTKADYNRAARGITGDEKPFSTQAEMDARTPGRELPLYEEGNHR